jgi:hypothetical protein
MANYAIVDSGWRGDAVGHLYFFAAAAITLYAWATSVRPYPNHKISALFYYVVLCGLAAVALAILGMGFTYRWTEVNTDGLVIHEGYYGLIWRQRTVPKSSIKTVEAYDQLQPGALTRVRVFGIRVCLVDGSNLILAQSKNEEFSQQSTKVRALLGIDGEVNP